jgi:hypothetical protein
VSLGEIVDVTLEKGGATFKLWLRPATDAARFYRRTTRFKIGYSGDPPDPLGYKLIDALCARIRSWERSPASNLHSRPAGEISEPAAGAATDDSAQALLAQTTFSTVHRDWLPVREQQLASNFARLTIEREKRVLLVNATKGLQFYASIADYFALLQRTHSRVRVTAASYFEDIFEFHQGVASKALTVTSARDVMTWSAAELNRFDVVLLIGASDVMLRLMALAGLTARLVLLDLGFYHQLLDSYPDWYPGIAAKSETRIGNLAEQINRVVVYSCQPEVKVKRDLAGVCAPGLLEWRWFNYIPIGFSYGTYYRADRRVFDVALLGTDRREYEQIDPGLFRGIRFLFLGAADRAPAIERLQAHLPVTAVSRVDEDTYARLLALCYCVVLPHRGDYVENVFMSVVDTVAAGIALVTPHHPGIDRLEDQRLPIVFYDTTPEDLFRQVSALLGDERRRCDIEERSIAFAREQLDIYRILGTILAEQVL